MTNYKDSLCKTTTRRPYQQRNRNTSTHAYILVFEGLHNFENRAENKLPGNNTDTGLEIKANKEFLERSPIWSFDCIKHN